MTHLNEDLKLEAYDYELPEERIAARPVEGRHHSKLLVYKQNSDEIVHEIFKDIVDEIPAGTTIVLNQSKVFPCRLFGQKSTGAKAEVFVLSLEKEDLGYPVLIKTGGKKKVGDRFLFAQDFSCTIVKINDGTFEVEFADNAKASDVVNALGSIPLPPYIRDGVSDEMDKETYQTVFAKEYGSVAAPTAGLHFTDELFSKLKEKNIEIAYVTLHVGLGTFAPVKSENIKDHNMHSERFFIDDENLKKIKSASKLVAVGTTSLRVLESMPENVEANKVFETDIFLHPGVEVKSIDGLITNFHLPKSSLIMLVSALIGREKTLSLYKTAIENDYRFFSYGDAMFIKRSGRLD